jgi:hypothetical protein
MIKPIKALGRVTQRVHPFWRSALYVTDYHFLRELQIGTVILPGGNCLDGSKTQPICFRLTLKML